MKKILLTLLTLMTPHVSALHERFASQAIVNSFAVSESLLQQMEDSTFQMEEVAGLIDIGVEMLRKVRTAQAQLAIIVQRFEQPHHPELVTWANNLEDRLRRIRRKVITGLVSETEQTQREVRVYDRLSLESRQEIMRHLSLCDQVLNALRARPLTAAEQRMIDSAQQRLNSIRKSLLEIKVSDMEELIDYIETAEEAVEMLQPSVIYLGTIRQYFQQYPNLEFSRQLGLLEDRIMQVKNKAIIKLDRYTQELDRLLPTYSQMNHEDQDTYITDLNRCDNIYNTLVAPGAIFTPEQQQKITSVQNRITMIRNNFVGTAS